MKTQFVKRISKTAAVIALATASSLCLVSNSFADGTNQFSCPGGGPDCLIAGYGQNQYNWLVNPPYDQATIANGNNLLQSLMPDIATTQSNMLGQGILNTLTTVDPTQIMIDSINNFNSPLTPTLASPVTALSVAQAATSSIVCGITPSADICKTAQMPLAEQTASYNLDTLLGPTVYQSINIGGNSTLDQNQSAQAFIQLLSGLNSPMPVVNFSNVASKDLPDLLNRTDVINYLTALRSYAAQEGVGLSNLYHYYAERVSVTGLGAAANLPPPTGSMIPPINASPLQVEDYYANRRLNDSNWYSQMQNASPAAIQREQLYLLAEIRSELFKNRMEMERMTATLSAMELQQAQGARTLLQQSAGAVKDPLKPPLSPNTQQ